MSTAPGSPSSESELATLGGDGEPRAMELTYRTDAALLITYAMHLSKGQLVLELGEPLPAGARVDLTLRAPDATIVVAGVVAWARGSGEGAPGQAPGMGITLTTPAEQIGEAIDCLAFHFRSVKALVAAPQPAPRALLIRYLRAIITCDVVEVDQKRLDDPGALQPAEGLDFGVIDLDSSGSSGYELYARLRQDPTAKSAPLLALAQLERDRVRAASVGFDEALANPPPYADLQAAALRCLGRPVSIRLGS
jgi:CheY-like chemotaxis protein